jgi:hypothetical protein
MNTVSRKGAKEAQRREGVANCQLLTPHRNIPLPQIFL